ALQDLVQLAVHDLHLAGPLGLVAADADAGALGHGVVLFLGAGHVVGEVGAVLVLQVDGGGALLGIVALLGLDAGLNGNGLVHSGGHVLVVGHDLAGGGSRLRGGGFGFRRRGDFGFTGSGL